MSGPRSSQRYDAMGADRTQPEYLPSPQDIARACLELHQARADQVGQGDVQEVLRERLARGKRAGDLAATLCWPIEDLGLPQNVVGELLARGMATREQLELDLTESDFLGLPLKRGTLARALRRLKDLGCTFAPEDPDENAAPPQAEEMAGVWRERIEWLAENAAPDDARSQRRLSNRESPTRGTPGGPPHTKGYWAKRRIKDALQALCTGCQSKEPRRKKCRRCKGRGRIGIIRPAAAAVEALGFDLAARTTAKVLRYVEGVRAELLAAG